MRYGKKYNAEPKALWWGRWSTLGHVAGTITPPLEALYLCSTTPPMKALYSQVSKTATPRPTRIPHFFLPLPLPQEHKLPPPPPPLKSSSFGQIGARFLQISLLVGGNARI